jgi:hypothetical protein
VAACRFAIPLSLFLMRGTISINNQVLSSSSHKIAYPFIADDVDGTINALGVRMGAITGSSPTYQIELQGLDSTGLPDGVAVTNSGATFNPTSLSYGAGSFNWVSITGATLTRGNVYALVVRYSSGTVDASNNASFLLNTSNIGPGESFGNPYVLTDTGSGWTKSTTPSTAPAFGYRSSTSTYGLPYQGGGAPTITTNGNRITSKFSIDANFASTVSVRGILLVSTSVAASGTYKVGIWNAAGTEIASSGSQDTDHQASTGKHEILAPFTSSAVLTAGTTYYAGIERVSTATLTPRTMQFSANRDLETQPFGSSCVRSDWNGSAWSDTTTEILPLILLLDGWSIPAGTSAPFILG